MHNTFSNKASENVIKGALLPMVTFRVQNDRAYYNPQQLENCNINRSATLTLPLVVPILERGSAEYSNVRRAKYRTRKSTINHDGATKQVKTRVKSGWARLDNAVKLRIRAAGEAVKAAEVTYKGMAQKEILVSKNVVDVLRAEEKQNKAKETRFEVKKLLIVAAYEIKSLVGDLTLKSTKLKMNYFSPKSEFKKVKRKIVAF